MTQQHELYISDCDIESLTPDPKVIQGDPELYYARAYDRVQRNIHARNKLAALEALKDTGVVAVVNQSPQEALANMVTVTY